MLSKRFIDAVRTSRVRGYELAHLGELDNTFFSAALNGIKKIKIGDKRFIKIGEALGLSPDEIFLKDPFLLPTRGLIPPLGMSVEDFRSGGRSPHSRTEEAGIKKKYSTFKRDPEYLLSQGMAVGISEDGEDGLVRHLQPYHDNQNFLGFVLKNMEGGKVSVQTRG